VAIWHTLPPTVELSTCTLLSTDEKSFLICWFLPVFLFWPIKTLAYCLEWLILGFEKLQFTSFPGRTEILQPLNQNMQLEK
jgi:hypothetical protein